MLNMMPYKFVIFFLCSIFLINCGGFQEQPIQVLADQCEQSTAQQITITGSDKITELCLSVESDLPIIAWHWSEDGSRFAYALQDVSVTLPPLSGRTGYYRPPATRWYITDSDGRNPKKFDLADNKNLKFSYDGKYIIVHEYCYYTKCYKTIYLTDTHQEVCKYQIREVWFGESNCSKLTHKNGKVWNIKAEVNQNGCDYYKQNGWPAPGCE